MRRAGGHHLHARPAHRAGQREVQRDLPLRRRQRDRRARAQHLPQRRGVRRGRPGGGAAAVARPAVPDADADAPPGWQRRLDQSDRLCAEHREHARRHDLDLRRPQLGQAHRGGPEARTCRAASTAWSASPSSATACSSAATGASKRYTAGAAASSTASPRAWCSSPTRRTSALAPKSTKRCAAARPSATS